MPSRRRGLGGDRGSEENPGVRPGTGSGYLQSDRDLQRPAGLDVHERVEQRLFLVEVGGQPPAPVAVQQRVQADMHLAPQMGLDDLRGQREVAAVLVPDALAPHAAHGGDPAVLPGVRVVPSCRVDIGARREQRAEERHLRRLRRPVMHHPRPCLEEGRLPGGRRSRLLRGHLQQAAQPDILRPQPRQLRLDHRREISHGHTLSTPSTRAAT